MAPQWHFWEKTVPLYKSGAIFSLIIMFAMLTFPSNTGQTILICNHFQTFHLCLFSVVDFNE